MTSSLTPKLTEHKTEDEVSQHAFHGRLVPLRTKAEIDATNVRITEVYITTIPVKAASTILKAVDSALRDAEPHNLHYLRRFVKPEHLPPHLRLKWEPQLVPPATFQYPAGPSTPDDDDRPANSIAKPSNEPHLHFLICSTNTIAIPCLHSLISNITAFADAPKIRTISVPLHAPTSSSQAQSWSQSYWPTIYKGGNPHGPHPSLVARAAAEIQNDGPKYMQVATRAGKEIRATGLGEAIGAVVVERGANGEGVIICVAGDARYRGMAVPEEQQPKANKISNPMAHATLRAIALVANKRLALSSPSNDTNTPSAPSPNFFADTPLNAFEAAYFTLPTLAPHGYLCLNLELYLTHEPCVMCSMAILHSRFGRVVFAQEMERTGGLVVKKGGEGGGDGDGNGGERGFREGYGLWWRRELNWNVLAWQWKLEVGKDGSEGETVGEETYA